MFMTLMFTLLLLVAAYVVARVIWPLPLPVWARGLLALLVVCSALKMPLVRVVYGSPNAWLNLPFQYISGYLQNVVLVLALLGLGRDALAGGVRLVSGRAGSARFVAGTAVCLVVLGCLGGGLTLWSAVRVPQVTAVTLELDGLDPAHDGLRIVQLSDLHIGPLFRGPWLDGVVRRVNELKPDMVFITGDVVDAPVARLADDVQPLGALQAMHGVFLVPGNHEFYSGFRDWVGDASSPGAFTRLGLEVLHNSHAVREIGGVPLVLAGVGDPVARRYGLETGSASRVLEAAGAAVPGAMRLLLAHRPDWAYEASFAGAAAQFSGHTHGGLTRLAGPFTARANGGFVRGLGAFGGMPVYVSAGTGLWGGFPFRLDVPSEITLLTLRRKAL